MEFLGIEWVGITPENGRKLLLSLVFITVIMIISRVSRRIVGWAARGYADESRQTRFWTRQGISLVTAVVMTLGLLSIWFNDPTRLATAFGLISAGLAFALQQVVTALAGYFVVLRGNTFTVGDRISMGGVRGDVVRLGFIQTTIMEMGQPHRVQAADPAMWVHSRQFTGRIVAVSNSRIFAEPVFNYTREFPYIWEEIMLPIPYHGDHARVEAIMLDAAHRHATEAAGLPVEAKADLLEKFRVEPVELESRVYMRITESWLELTVRFLVGTHRIRGVKDAMSRHMMAELRAAGIALASTSIEIGGVTRLQLERRLAPQGSAG